MAQPWLWAARKAGGRSQAGSGLGHHKLGQTRRRRGQHRPLQRRLCHAAAPLLRPSAGAGGGTRAGSLLSHRIPAGPSAPQQRAGATPPGSLGASALALTYPSLLATQRHPTRLRRCPSPTAPRPHRERIPILVPISMLPPSSCQHHQKEHLTENKPFFSPLVLPAHLSLARGRQSCQCLNLTHPFNLGGRNTFVPDNVHQMVARGAPVAAVPDGWATRALPDLCLYVICIAAGGFSSRRQLQHHLPGRSSSPGMAAGSSGQEGPGHTAAAGTTAPREAVSHRARGGERPPCPGEGLQAVPVPPAWLRWDWRDWDNPAGSRAGTCRAQGMEDALTTGSATSHGRRERSCCTCPLGDILPTRGPVTVTERVRSWAAQSPGDG